MLLPVPSNKLATRQNDALRLRGRAAEREVEHEQHDDDGGRGAHGHVLPIFTSGREVCAGGERRVSDARREKSIESDANNSDANNGRTPSHTSSVRRDAVARPELAGREVRVSGRAALMIPLAQLARAHAAVAHGDCARDLYASTRAALGPYGLVR